MTVRPCEPDVAAMSCNASQSSSCCRAVCASSSSCTPAVVNNENNNSTTTCAAASNVIDDGDSAFNPTDVIDLSSHLHPTLPYSVIHLIELYVAVEHIQVVCSSKHHAGCKHEKQIYMTVDLPRLPADDSGAACRVNEIETNVVMHDQGCGPDDDNPSCCTPSQSMTWSEISLVSGEAQQHNGQRSDTVVTSTASANEREAGESAHCEIGRNTMEPSIRYRWQWHRRVLDATHPLLQAVNRLYDATSTGNEASVSPMKLAIWSRSATDGFVNYMCFASVIIRYERSYVKPTAAQLQQFNTQRPQLEACQLARAEAMTSTNPSEWFFHDCQCDPYLSGDDNSRSSTPLESAIDGANDAGSSSIYPSSSHALPSAGCTQASPPTTVTNPSNSTEISDAMASADVRSLLHSQLQTLLPATASASASAATASITQSTTIYTDVLASKKAEDQHCNLR